MEKRTVDYSEETHEESKLPVARIGIFDSGVGGLSLLKKLMHIFPAEYIYYADTAHAPYGNKSAQEIINRAQFITSELLDYNIDLMIIACHTASAHAVPKLLQSNPQLPIINSTDLIVQPTIDMQASSIGVLATPATIATHIHRDQLMQHNPSYHIIEQACPDLALAIETQDDARIQDLLKAYLQPLQAYNLDTLLLGCTHYCLIKDKIKTYFPKHMRIISAQDHLDPALEPYEAMHAKSNLKVLTSGSKLPAHWMNFIFE